MVRGPEIGAHLGDLSLRLRIKARLSNGERLTRTLHWPPDAGFGWTDRTPAATTPPEDDPPAPTVAALLARLEESFPGSR